MTIAKSHAKHTTFLFDHPTDYPKLTCYGMEDKPQTFEILKTKRCKLMFEGAVKWAIQGIEYIGIETRRARQRLT